MSEKNATRPELPSRVELTSNHKGAIGEALFNATYGPPQTVETIVKRIAWRATPDFVDLDEIRVQSLPMRKSYTIDYNGKLLSWEPDCFVTVRYSSWPTEGTTSSTMEEWSISVPVELKTGEYAEFERGQKQVMELLASREGIFPLLVQLSIDDLPDAFTVVAVEPLGFEI